jgi:hypothetical protein
MKSPKDRLGNRTRYFPARNSVPQPTAYGVAASVHQQREHVFFIKQYTRVRSTCLKGHDEEACKVTQHVRANANVNDKNEKMRLREAKSEVRTVRPAGNLVK